MDDGWKNNVRISCFESVLHWTRLYLYAAYCGWLSLFVSLLLPGPAPSRNYRGKTISDFLQYINILMKANPTFKLSAMIRDLKSLTYTQEKIAF